MSDVEKPARRRLALYVIASVFGVLLLLLISGFAVLRSDAGLAWIKTKIETAASEPGGLNVAIGRLAGPLPATLRLEEVVLSDAEGVWLTADRIALDWRPLSLIAGKLSIDSLLVGTLQVVRAPDLPESEPVDDEPFAIPELPVELTLERLAIERLALGEALLGEAAVLQVEGAAGAQRASGVMTSLSVQRLDAAAGEIELRAGLDPTGKILTLDVSAAEPPGGLVARLLALPDLPEVALTLRGEGPLEAWSGDLSGRLGGLANWQGEIGLSVAEGGYGITLEGALTLQPPQSDPLAPLLTGEMGYDLALQLDRDEILTVERMALANDAVAMDAEGRLALDDLDSDLTLRLTLADPEALAALAPGLTLAGFAIEAGARGPLLQPAITASARADGLTLAETTTQGLALDLTLTPRLPLNDPAAVLQLSAEGRVAAIEMKGLESLQSLLSPGLTLDLDGVLDLGAERLELAALTIATSAAEAAARGAIELAEPRAKLDLDLTLPSLDAFEPLAGIPLAGRAALRTAVDASPDDPEITLPFSLEVANLALGQPAATALLGPEPRAAGRIALHADGGLDVERLQIDGAGLGLTAQAEIPTGFEEIQARYELTLPELAMLADALGSDLAGRLTLTGTAAGALADPSVEAELEGEALALAGLSLDRATVTAEAETVVSGAKGRLDAELLAADLPSKPVIIGTTFAHSGSQIALGQLALRAAGSEVGGDLALDLKSGLASGEITGRIGDLAPWLAFAGQRGSGQGELKVALSAAQARQAVVADLTLRSLEVSGANSPTVAASSLSLHAESNDVALLAGEADLEVNDFRLDTLLVQRARLAGKGSAEALDLSLSAETREETPFNLDADGRLSLNGDALALTLTRLQGEVRDQPFALQRPVEASRSSQRTAVTGLDLSIAGGRLTGGAALQGKRIEADLTIADLPLELAREIADLPGLEGSLEARLTLEGAAPTPVGVGRVTVSGLKTELLAEAPPLGVEIRADWRAARLDLDGEITGFADEPASLALSLPLRLDADGLTPVLEDRAPLSGQLAWSGPIERIWPLVPLSDQELSGPAELQAELSGTTDAPIANGRLAMIGGRYENASSGTLLTDLELSVLLSERQVEIEKLSAADGGAGRIDLEGSAELSPEQGFPFEIRGKLQDFTALRRDEVTGALAGEVAVTGSMEAAAVTGALETRGVEIRIPNQMPPNVVELEVREVNRAAAGLPPLPSAETTAPTTPVSLNVGVELPGKVFVRGRGLDSEWQGTLQVSGSAEAPEVVGALSLVRGQLSILSRDFALTRGKIDFPGGSEIDPLLDIVAENESDDLTVELRLLGPASRPQFELTSQPVLPQDEVLARVLFGKATTQLTPIEALQLASAAAELSGQGSGTGALDYARDLIGVDTLRFESAEGGAGAPALAAGKAVTDDVYVGVKQGATPGSGNVGVEIEVYPNVLLESGVGQGGSSNLGVKFKWDY